MERQWSCAGGEYSTPLCEPPGLSISNCFVGPLGSYTVGKRGSQTVDLGEVEVQPMQGGWALTEPRVGQEVLIDFLDEDIDRL